MLLGGELRAVLQQILLPVLLQVSIQPHYFASLCSLMLTGPVQRRVKFQEDCENTEDFILNKKDDIFH